MAWNQDLDLLRLCGPGDANGDDEATEIGGGRVSGPLSPIKSEISVMHTQVQSSSAQQASPQKGYDRMLKGDRQLVYLDPSRGANDPAKCRIMIEGVLFDKGLTDLDSMDKAIAAGHTKIALLVDLIICSCCLADKRKFGHRFRSQIRARQNPACTPLA